MSPEFIFGQELVQPSTLISQEVDVNAELPGVLVKNYNVGYSVENGKAYMDLLIYLVHSDTHDLIEIELSINNNQRSENNQIVFRKFLKEIQVGQIGMVDQINFKIPINNFYHLRRIPPLFSKKKNEFYFEIKVLSMKKEFYRLVNRFPFFVNNPFYVEKNKILITNNKDQQEYESINGIKKVTLVNGSVINSLELFNGLGKDSSLDVVKIPKIKSETQSLFFEFNELEKLTDIILISVPIYPIFRIDSVSVSISRDNLNFLDFGSFNNINSVLYKNRCQTLFISGSPQLAKYVKINLHTTKKNIVRNYSLSEVYIYGNRRN